MLVLTQRPGQTTEVQFNGATLKVTTLEFRNGAVRLGFDAPREVRILREELVEEVNHATA